MEILQRPLITEKMSKKSDALNQYGFIVDERADKIQIKKAVEDMYGVTVESVNTIRYAGKVKARNTKSGVVVGKTNSYKKAIVSLKQGEQIDFYSNIYHWILISTIPYPLFLQRQNRFFRKEKATGSYYISFTTLMPRR